MLLFLRRLLFHDKGKELKIIDALEGWKNWNVAAISKLIFRGCLNLVHVNVLVHVQLLRKLENVHRVQFIYFNQKELSKFLGLKQVL